MTMVRMIDWDEWDDCPEDLVGFVQAIPITRGKGMNETQEVRYFSAVFKKPMVKNSKPQLACGHSHWTVESATECMKRLIKLEAEEST